MVGHLFTPEDEIDVLHDDLGRARRRLHDLERAPFDGRLVNREVWMDSVDNARNRVAFLERELAGALADQIAAAEAFECGGVR